MVKKYTLRDRIDAIVKWIILIIAGAFTAFPFFWMVVSAFKTKDEIMNLLKISNKKYNQTIIMITHDLSLASKTDRIITIKDGKIISDTKC